MTAVRLPKDRRWRQVSGLNFVFHMFDVAVAAM